MPEVLPRVVEKYYSPAELAGLLNFGTEKIRHLAQEGEFTITVDGAVIAQPALIAGELRIPASGVNAYLARHPYRYDAGIKARNHGELRRKLGQECKRLH